MKLRSLLGPAWRRQWRWLALGIALMLVSAVAALVLLGLSGWLITASAMAGLGMIAALDIFTPGGGIRLAAVTRTVARYGERLATHRATLGLLAAVRLNLMRRLLRLDELQLRRLERGDTLNRLTRDVETLDHLFSGVAGPLLTAVLGTLGVCLVLLWLTSGQAALVIATAGVAGAVVTWATARGGRRPGLALARREPALRRHCTESLEGLKSLIAEQRMAEREEILEQLSTHRIARQRRLDRLDVAGRALINATGYVGVWLVLLAVLADRTGQQPSGPVAVMAVIVALGLVEIWQALPAAWRQLTRSRIAADRIGELAGREATLDAGGGAVPDASDFRLRAVNYAWPGAATPVVDGLDLDIANGERLLVTGASGSGKTTLGLLLMRQIDPDGGIIRLGGLDLRDIDADVLRRHIGYLPQQPVVFADTLAANLRVAAPEASDAQMKDALRASGLADWLQSLEQSLETWLDEGGAGLSGGELRRVGLARLMLVDPPAVILDEPTTGLDKATAIGLASSLERWLEGRTVVMISHEPEWLPRYDRVIRL
ncbi:thiol reductant ABC exporter subunit CydC [Wenzhouxiangella sp. EGI_FJ10305]|uniref:thiol reductant ABC exporter subunit CydC n=1 Tax=Wenzhouxiangella sp. EGI_FJ10305 TaxID=3243768 RepID=UPI0035E36D42